MFILKLGKDTGLNNGTNVTEVYPHGSRVKIQCDDGFVSTNANRTNIKCAKGRWKPELPDCKPGKQALIEFQIVFLIYSPLAPCITPTIANGKFRTSPKVHHRKHFSRSSSIILESGQSVPHNRTIELLCADGYHYGTSSPVLNVTLKCSFGSWDSFAASSYCVPLPCKLPAIKHGGYLNGWEPHQLVEHEVELKYSCDSGFKRSFGSEDSESSTLKCALGKLEPEKPRCLNATPSQETITVKPQELDLLVPLDSQSGSLVETSPSSSFCHSPKKIENALHYFGKLFSRTSRFQPISIAQFGEPPNGELKNESLFQYDHGTEIIFRCVNYQIPIGLKKAPDDPGALMQMDETAEETTTMIPITTTTLTPERSTWIIKCENGNWIGSAFECGKCSWNIQTSNQHTFNLFNS